MVPEFFFLFRAWWTHESHRGRRTACPGQNGPREADEVKTADFIGMAVRSEPPVVEEWLEAESAEHAKQPNPEGLPHMGRSATLLAMNAVRTSDKATVFERRVKIRLKPLLGARFQYFPFEFKFPVQ